MNPPPPASRGAVIKGASFPRLGGLRGPTQRLVSHLRQTSTRPAALAAALILSCMALRLLLMLTVGFGNDEAYTIASARTLHLSYFDHPPLHLWLAHAAALAFGETRWVRLPFVVLFCATGWLVFLLTRRFYGGRAALWALLCLNLSPFFVLSAGGWVVPDGPLLPCLLAAVLAISGALFPRDGHPSSPWRAWTAGGLWLGLAGLSKYNAVLVAASLVAFVSVSPRHRHWLRHPAPYLGALVAAAIVSPVLVWNAQNGWVSFAFQMSRGLPQAGMHPMGLLAMAAGEVALLSPWICVPLVAATVTACRWPSRRDSFFLTLTLPTVACFTLTPLWGAHGLPHWPMPGWLFAYPLLGAWLEHRCPRWFSVRRWAVGSSVAFALLLSLALALTRVGWPSRDAAPAGGTPDPTLETLDWTALRMDGSARAVRPSFVVTSRWMDAGKVALALEPGIQVYVFSDDPRQFAFAPPVSRFLGDDALVVLPAGRLAVDLPRIRPFFADLDPVEHFWIGRGGAREIDLALVHARTLLAPFPVPYPHGADSPGGVDATSRGVR